MKMNENEQTLNDYEEISVVDNDTLNEATIQEEITGMQHKGTPWKELSIGGTFGLLLAGGGLYASGMTKGDDEDGLLAGAQVSDSVAVAGAKTPEGVEPADDDPVMLDEDGNPVLPVSRQQAEARMAEVAREDHAAHQPQSHASTASAQHSVREDAPRVVEETPHDAAVAQSHADTPHITVNVYDHHPQTDTYVDADGVNVHPVNIMTIDYSLPFDQAFAMAREQLGSGQAFIWRDGVYGTFNQTEWHSLSRSEQHEFTNVAVREFQQMDAPQSLASHHQPTHFVEGTVVGADDVVVIDDEAAGGDDVSVVSDDDVMIIESQNEASDLQPEIITLDNDLDGMEQQIAAMLDADGDGQLTSDDVLGTLATLVNEIPDIDSGVDAIDPLFDGSQDAGPSDDMPDYVSDADTVGLV